MGNEIKKDMCPEKYYEKGSIVKDSIFPLIALLIVSVFSGNLLSEGGISVVVSIVIEVVIVCIIYGLIFLMLKGMKKRLKETYISVCEKGVCGVCPLNGYKNKNFELYYNEITKVVVKGERLFLYSKKGNVILTLKDTLNTAELIKSLSANL